MRRSRTPQPPLFDVMRPKGNNWRWDVTYSVASSGYVIQAHVTATRMPSDEGTIGSASCAVEHDMPLNEVLEFLAIEAMLAACEPNMFEVKSHHNTTFVASSF